MVSGSQLLEPMKAMVTSGQGELLAEDDDNEFPYEDIYIYIYIYIRHAGSTGPGELRRAYPADRWREVRKEDEYDQPVGQSDTETKDGGCKRIDEQIALIEATMANTTDDAELNRLTEKINVLRCHQIWCFQDGARCQCFLNETSVAAGTAGSAARITRTRSRSPHRITLNDVSAWLASSNRTISELASITASTAQALQRTSMTA